MADRPAANVPASTLPPLPAPGPLQESDFIRIRQALVQRLAVKRAARTAMTSAVITLIIGGASLPLTLLCSDLASVLIAAAICAIGVMEYLGCRKMRRADPSAARHLGINQMAFLGVIILYCLAQVFTFSPEKAKAAAISPEVRAQLYVLPDTQQAIDSQIERWAPVLTYGFYSLVIVLSVCCQGGLAWYYFSRRRHVETFNQNTPQWIRRLFIEIGV